MAKRKRTADDLVGSVVNTRTLERERDAKAQIRYLESQVDALLKELGQTRSLLGIADKLSKANVVAPVLRKEKTSGLREACPVILASDLHLEEVVRPETVNGLNEYNPKIAEARMKEFVRAATWEIALERNAFKIHDVVLWFGGDIISNWLHLDQMQTNALSPVRALIFARNLLVMLVRELRALDLNVRVVCSVGNHDRMGGKRVQVANRVDTSLGTLLYAEVAARFADDVGVSFDLPSGEVTYIDVFGRRLRFLHSDSVKFGGGVGGVVIPLSKAVMQLDKAIMAHHTFVGHWHQSFTYRRLTCNGSLIGYTAFSQHIKAEPEPPQQGMCLMDSKRGVCHPKSLWVDKNSPLV